ncbi:hypothetical protein ACSHT0_16700 [Tepidicaulis sp. LMO-SS28]|uniref:hypothetical protein n=1 Tax=Tepidicaulis sp. LMO-SS28 TaxID=3447455 RepID=UPI003EE134BA
MLAKLRRRFSSPPRQQMPERYQGGPGEDAEHGSRSNGTPRLHGADLKSRSTGEPDMAKTQKAGGKAPAAKTAKAPAKEAATASKAKKGKK